MPSAATSSTTTTAPSSDDYLAIVTTEAHGIHEHRFKKSEHTPKPDEIVAEVAFSGFNHIDVAQVETASYVPAFPYVLGKEWSGRVVELGSNVKDLQIGDQIIGLGYHIGGLQERITTPRAYVCRKPDNYSLEEGATIPHRYAAVFVALFLKNGLHLPLEPSEEQKRDKHIIVWGAATGSGMFAIQALKAQGYRTIIAVASLKQKEKLLSLGATEVFDRNNPEIANEIKAKYPNKISDGLVCQIDPQGWSSLLTIVKPDGDAEQNPATIAHIIRRVPPEVPQGVTLRRTVAFVLLQDPLGDSVIAQILPKLLTSPNFQLPKPAEVVVKGTLLERVQAAIKVAEDNTEVSVVVKVQ